MENWFEYAINGNTKGLIELLNEVDVDSRGDIGERKNWTALMFASRFSNSTSSLDTVKLLLENGADVNLKNDNKATPLLMAARISNIDSSYDTVKLLLEYGADVNLKNIDGWTALMMSARYSNTDSTFNTVKLLLEYGADINLKNNEGWTTVMLAARYSNNESSLDTVKLLLKHNPDVNLFKNNGHSALMIATKYSNDGSSLDTVKSLLEYGADPFVEINCPTEECRNIIDEARWKRLYQRDKETAKRYSKNSEYYLPKEIWEIILLEKRRQLLCQNLSSDKNKVLLKLFAIELGIEITDRITKAQLCGYISTKLVYGKEDKYKGVVKSKLDKGVNHLLTLARTFGINTDRPLSEVISDLAKMY